MRVGWEKSPPPDDDGADVGAQFTPEKSEQPRREVDFSSRRERGRKSQHGESLNRGMNLQNERVAQIGRAVIVRGASVIMAASRVGGGMVRDRRGFRFGSVRDAIRVGGDFPVLEGVQRRGGQEEQKPR